MLRATSVLMWDSKIRPTLFERLPVSVKRTLRGIESVGLKLLMFIGVARTGTGGPIVCRSDAVSVLFVIDRVKPLTPKEVSDVQGALEAECDGVLLAMDLPTSEYHLAAFTLENPKAALGSHPDTMPSPQDRALLPVPHGRSKDAWPHVRAQIMRVVNKFGVKLTKKTLTPATRRSPPTTTPSAPAARVTGGGARGAEKSPTFESSGLEFDDVQLSGPLECGDPRRYVLANPTWIDTISSLQSNAATKSRKNYMISSMARYSTPALRYAAHMASTAMLRELSQKQLDHMEYTKELAQLSLPGPEMVLACWQQLWNATMARPEFL